MALHNRDIAPGCPELRYSKTVEVWVRDEPWHGWWDVTRDEAGKRVLNVSAAYGSRTDRDLGRRNPEKRAKELLTEIVRGFTFHPVPEIHQTRKPRRR